MDTGEVSHRLPLNSGCVSRLRSATANNPGFGVRVGLLQVPFWPRVQQGRHLVVACQLNRVARVGEPLPSIGSGDDDDRATRTDLGPGDRRRWRRRLTGIMVHLWEPHG